MVVMMMVAIVILHRLQPRLLASHGVIRRKEGAGVWHGL
jgi:hypothetical protein